MFNNVFFENWLDEKCHGIMTKLNLEQQISSDEMIILILKAQSNHFSHMDDEFRQEFVNVRKEFREEFVNVRKEFREEFVNVRKEIKILREDMDKRFDRIERHFYWLASLLVPLCLGMSYQLFIKG
ncbi:MAG: hypothetical protein KBD63_03260 [Bacteriovoracaceae bacterium]|nr:hypothetical protein [Bacteriovoracaceae bacterium]